MTSELLEKASFPARIAVGGVLIYASIAKLSAPTEEFAYAIESYKLLSASLVMPAAHFIQWFELYMGVFLIFGIFTRFFSLLSAATFLAFEFFLLQAAVRGLPIANCGCFGSSGSNSILTELLLNLIWLILSLLVFKKGSFLSLDFLLDRMENHEKK